MRHRRSRGTTHWPISYGTSSISIAIALLWGSTVQAQSVPGRWGQSSILLSPLSKPHLLVTSGKTYVAGQTLLSTPSTSSPPDSFLSLDLSQPMVDLSNPPWTPPMNGTGGSDPPVASWGNFVALNETTGFYFGGDATGDPVVPVQTRQDSSHLVSVSMATEDGGGGQGQLVANWQRETSEWTSQPERRESSLMTSASNGKTTRTWIYGGVRADGSGIGFNELWEMQMNLSNGQVEWAQSSGSTVSGPSPAGAIYDGMAVLIPSRRDPTIYFLGGVDASLNQLVPFSTIYTFTPSDTVASGTWSSVAASMSRSTTVPIPRRGHSAVYLPTESKIWVSGGRDLAGSTVYADSWLFDIQDQSWTRVSDLREATWGSSSVVLGETILTSFGYGSTAPASTALQVYAFGNDTWLDSYHPSYLAIPTKNPKASSNPSNASDSPLSSISSSNNPSNPKAHSAPESPSSSTDDTSDSPHASSDPSSSSQDGDSTWTSPGQPHSSPSDSSTTSGTRDPNGKDHSPETGPSKSMVAGAVVGSLLGALVIAALGVYGMKKRKRASSFGEDRFTSGKFTRGRDKRYTHSAADGDEEEYLGMVEKEKGNLAAIRGGGGAGGFSSLFTALPMAAGATPRFGGIVGSNQRRRFDMLRDEADQEEEPSSRSWTRFDEDEKRRDGDDDTVRADRIVSELGDTSARIGVGIWGNTSVGGLGRSESVKSGTSYLGTSLGGFLRTSESSHVYGELAGLDQGGSADASLTPIAEWDEDQDEDEEEEGTFESGYAAGFGDYSFSAGGARSGARSTETHQTKSTTTHTSVNSDEEAAIKTATRLVRPFSPASTSSLYGSRFATPQPGEARGIERSMSSSSSLFLSPIRRDNSSSWWSRLKPHQPTEIPTATAFEAIRDPTPAPNLDRPERLRDPFSDPVPTESQKHPNRSNSTSEHGLMTSRSVRGVHDRSISSNVSEVTATSSILEERMRGMDVVQRVQSEGSDGNGSIGTSSNQNTPDLAQDPFSDPSPAFACAREPGSVIFAGSQAAFSPRGDFGTPSVPPFPLLPVLLPVAPSRAQSPPPSPHKSRLMGPRPQPSPALPSIARSGSVKDLVAEIERRNSLPSTTPVSSPHASPSKAVGHRTRVQHGLVKKPKLYVANP